MKEKFCYITKAKNESYTHIRPDGVHVTVIYFKDTPRAERSQYPWINAKKMPVWAQRRMAVEPTGGRLECDVCGYVDQTELKTAVKLMGDGVVRCAHCRRKAGVETK